MRADAMNKKVEIIFTKEYKRLLDIRDVIGTKGYKKHAKHEAKAILNHK